MIGSPPASGKVLNVRRESTDQHPPDGQLLELVAWPTLYGGFAGEPLDDNSPEYVFLARR